MVKFYPSTALFYGWFNQILPGSYGLIHVCKSLELESLQEKNTSNLMHALNLMHLMDKKIPKSASKYQLVFPFFTVVI